MLAQQQQEAQKNQHKSWHDRQIKKKDINTWDLVLLYDSQINGKPHKLGYQGVLVDITIQYDTWLEEHMHVQGQRSSQVYPLL
jgi:hypothetical protein